MMTIKEMLGNTNYWKKDISLDVIDRSMNKIPASVIINIWRHQMNELRRLVDTSGTLFVGHNCEQKFRLSSTTITKLRYFVNLIPCFFQERMPISMFSNIFSKEPFLT